MSTDLANHLWQSTLFAAGIGLLALFFRHNQARVRYAVWFTASIKFLIPFTLLIGLGSRLEWQPSSIAPEVSSAVVQAAEPFAATADDIALAVSPAMSEPIWPARALIVCWLIGVAALLIVRLRGWRRIRRMLRASEPLDIPGIALPAHVSVRTAPGVMEPGVVGLWRPVLLLPSGIGSHLPAEQLDAVLQHELCHVSRRDNLTALLHMVVETVFWFHPLVWWIGGRLVTERERACDEHVLRVCAEPQIYAEGILNVCRRYLETPLTCVSGVGGADLRDRIEAIMANRTGCRLGVTGRLAIAAAAVVAVTLPVTAGALARSPLQSSEARADRPAFAVASVRVNTSGDVRVTGGVQPGGRYAATNISLDMLIATAFQPLQRIEVTGIPDWARTARYDVDARADGNVPPAQIWLMLQTLLEDRFKLVWKRELRDQPIYTFTLAQPGRFGPQLRPHTDDSGCVDPSLVAPGNGLPVRPDPNQPLPKPPCGAWSGAPALGRMAGQRVQLETLGRSLIGQLGRMVVDRTGLTGAFDLLLEWTPAQPLAGPNPEPINPDRPDLSTALREQLGIRLVSDTGPVNMLVIESVDRASEN